MPVEWIPMTEDHRPYPRQVIFVKAPDSSRPHGPYIYIPEKNAIISANKADPHVRWCADGLSHWAPHEEFDLPYIVRTEAEVTQIAKMIESLFGKHVPVEH